MGYGVVSARVRSQTIVAGIVFSFQRNRFARVSIITYHDRLGEYSPVSLENNMGGA